MISYGEILLFTFSLYVALHGLIIVHELGHFLAARLVGAPVTEICSGLRPELFSRKFRFCRFVVKLLPIAGYVSIVGAVLLPLRTKAVFAELRAIASDHPGLDKRNWLRKKALWKRVLVLGMGPLFSIVFGFLLAPTAVMLFGSATSFNCYDVPADALCAAAVVADLEVKEISLVQESVVDVSFGGQSIACKPRDPSQDKGIRKNLQDALESFWKKDPEGLVQVKLRDSDFNYHSEESFDMESVLRKHFQRLRLQSCSNDLWKFNFSSSDKRYESFSYLQRLLLAKPDERSFKQAAWEKTLIGAFITQAKVMWINSPTAFLMYFGLLSVVVGITNLLPIFPLDGGRIAMELGASAGVRGKKLQPKVEKGTTISAILVFLVLFFLPLLYDVLLLVYHLIVG